MPLTLDGSELMFTTDGFTVQPLEFPGGNIGTLAVHGTTNDLAVAGATPRYLSLNAFIEEGLEIATLERIIASLGQAARDIGVAVVAGDTKVLRRGEGGGLYLATTGIGIRHPHRLGLDRIRDGDVLLVSGPVGDHGIAVMLAREAFGLHGELLSDAASVLPLTQAALRVSRPALHARPDTWRPGHRVSRIAARHRAGRDAQPAGHPGARPRAVGLRDAWLRSATTWPAKGACSRWSARRMPTMYWQCWHALPQGNAAAIIGSLQAAHRHVLMKTAIGGERILEELEDDPLPRIC